MNILIARIITTLIAVLMVLFFYSPLRLSSFYIIFRPLVQPFAYLYYTLFLSIPLTSVFSILLIVFAYVSGVFNKNNTIKHYRILPIYFMLFFSIISIYFSLNYVHSIGQILKILSGLSLYILLFNSINSKKDLNTILWAYMLCSIIPMLFGYYQYITGTGHAWKGEYYIGSRIDSFLGEYNAYGEFLCITICTTLMLLIQEKNRNRMMIILVILGSLFASLILSLNRGSWISLAIGFIIASFFYIRKIKITWIVIGCLVLCIASGGIVKQRFEELNEKTGTGTKNTFLGRIEAWKIIFPLVLEKPITGYGIGTVQLVTKEYLKKEIIPHNDYLRLCIEIGIPGALFYISFLFIEIISSLRNLTKKKNWHINYPLLICVIYFTVLSTFQNIISNVTVFPMFLGLLGVSHKYNSLNMDDENKRIDRLKISNA